RARDTFGQRPFMRFEVLDIDREPAEQGFAAGSYDLIIASNVLHATRDLRVTLDRVRTLLAPGGTLCMFEVTRPRAWVDLTVGLTDGWWLFEDEALRSENPVLTRDSWLALLGTAGFESAAATGDPDASTGLAGQSIILARRPARSVTASRWLVCGSPDGLSAGLVERLRSEGAHVFGAALGERFASAED